MQMISCSRFPCGGHAGGCSFADCTNNQRFIQTPGFPPPMVAQPTTPMGCICPPTSEKTCEGPFCPRKNHLKSA